MQRLFSQSPTPWKGNFAEVGFEIHAEAPIGESKQLAWQYPPGLNWRDPRSRFYARLAASTCAIQASSDVWMARPRKAARRVRRSGSLRQPMA